VNLLNKKGHVSYTPALSSVPGNVRCPSAPGVRIIAPRTATSNAFMVEARISRGYLLRLILVSIGRTTNPSTFKLSGFELKYK
jgi:hypothetical protein